MCDNMSMVSHYNSCLRSGLSCTVPSPSSVRPAHPTSCLVVCFLSLQVKSKLKGHSKRITGLAFSTALNVLVSSAADNQVLLAAALGPSVLRCTVLRCDVLFPNRSAVTDSAA